jgi:uncharacterized protein YqjF (DUF2071 family)
MSDSLGFAVAARLEPEILIVGGAAFQKKCPGKMGEVAGEGRMGLFVSHKMASMRRSSLMNHPTPPRVLLADRAHRPYPLPSRSWIMTQSWHTLLFAHWRVPVEALRALIPATLDVDTYGGEAWVGVVPFRMTDIRFHGQPTYPYVSAFAEMNVRAYVTRDGLPGVWFFSLDAANPVAVEVARLAFHLPYFNARMRVERDGDAIRYDSQRKDRRAVAGAFRGVYRPVSPVYRSEAGSLDAWLTERYCLYAAKGHRLWRADIHHAPWPLQHAEAEIEVNTVADLTGLRFEGAPLLHYAERLDVLAWGPTRVV